jgi:hypothetical protein
VGVWWSHEEMQGRCRAGHYLCTIVCGSVVGKWIRVWTIFDDVVIAVAGHAISQDEVVFHGLLANYFTACYHL